jgi:hypothetical protein
MAPTMMSSRGARVAALLALACLGIVVAVAVSSLGRSPQGAVDDLPTVAEILAAQSHRHGVDVPRLTPEQEAALAAPLRPGTTVEAYEQLRIQLRGVAEVEGLGAAVRLLGEVTQLSDDARRECDRLYADLLTGDFTSPGTPVETVASPCP